MQEKFVLKTMKKVAAISTGVAMLGATLTGAMALDLKDYPAPFVVDGVYDDANAFVVGAEAIAADTLAALDIAANLQFESKTAVDGEGVISVSGGTSEKVPLGKGLSNTTFFDTQMDDSDISSLFDGTITFGTSSYDTSEQFQMTDQNDPKIATSLTSGEDDFKTDVFITASRSKMVYAYKFDKTINISGASTTNPVTIDFLGKKLKITGVTDTDTFTAYVGDEHYMMINDEVTVAGKTVKLTSVSTTKAVVSVDGVTDSVSSGSSVTINGIQVTVDSLFSRDKLEESSATLILGTVSSKTYNDEDAYIGEDENNPDWVWELSSLTASGTSQVLSVKNYFRKLTNSDKPTGVGECYSFPNDYIQVCLESLTVADADMGEYTFEVDTTVALDQAIGTAFASTPAVYIHTGVTDGMELRTFGALDNDTLLANVTSTVKTKDVWLSIITREAMNGTTYPGEALGVFYKDTSDSRVKLYGAYHAQREIGQDETILRINHGNTKDDNIILKYDGGSLNTSTLNMTLDIVADSTSDLADTVDDIDMVWGISSLEFNRLGVTADTEEAGELQWSAANTGIGSKDEDHRSHYGIIIKNPKSNSGAERVLLQIPNDQAYANVIIKGKAATVTSTGESYVPTAVSIASMTHDEVTSPEDFNLILVGGPCANPLVVDVFGLTCDGWDHAAGEAVVRLAANGEKVAMLVAGTDAQDTRRAGKAVAAYADYAFEGTEALVKGTTLTDITVEAAAAAAEEA